VSNWRSLTGIGYYNSINLLTLLNGRPPVRLNHLNWKDYFSPEPLSFAGQ